MAQVPLVSPLYQSPLTAAGTTNALGLVYTYAAGTLTPKTTYTDSAGGTPNANPVVLDASGQASIWGTGSYKFVVKTAAGVTIDTQDNYTAFNSSTSDTVTDSTFIIADDADPTKKLQFQCSSISPGTTTVITIPDGNATMATSPSLAANTFLANATTGSAAPTGVALSASNLAGRGSTGNITAITLSGLSMAGTVLTASDATITTTDVTTNDVSTSKHGFVPKAPNDATKFLDGTGVWATGGAAAGLTTIASGSFGAVTLVDITSIPSTYRGLILYISGASNTVATRGLRVEIGDSTHDFAAGNYCDYTQIAGTTTSQVSVGSANISPWTEITQTAAQTSSAVIVIPAYQSGPAKTYTAKYNAAATSGSEWSTGTSTIAWGTLHQSSDGLPKTGAVDRIRVTWNNVATGVFDAGTYALYGIN